jgi:dTDP-4-dehydrorhamnose 3,5-epimerase
MSTPGPFQVLETTLPGVRVLQPRLFEDVRGRFVKTYQADAFQAAGIDFVPHQEFYSVSTRGVLRGMHFQVPPAAHQKLVYCSRGRVLDVVLDLRKGSPGFGHAYSRELTAETAELLFIPKGLAHGFLALEDDSTMVYQMDTVYTPECDAGILWNSFGFDWPVAKPILSERDKAFPGFTSFVSPFSA